MQRSLVVLTVFAMTGCGTDRLPNPMYPPVDPPGSAPHGDSSEADEIAEEKAIVNDPAIIAAAEKVKVIQNDHLECPSEVVGLVDIHEPVESVDRALTILKRKGARVGADAIIGVEFHHGEPGDEATHLSGLAVRCNDLIKGRAYDVLGRIEVKGRMGKEDDAEKDLMARATAMHADMVIGIGFEHGEGGAQPTRVWGTAIRFK